MKFTIEKYTSNYANSILVSLYNLNANSRGLIQRPNGFMIINAGYDGELFLMATGIIHSARPARQGPDLVMNCELLDNGFDIGNAPISVNVGPGGTNQQLLKQALNLFQANHIPSGALEPLPVFSYSKGYAYGGTVGGLLDGLLKPQNLRWQILDGQLRIFAAVGPTTQAPPILLSVDTGLIEIPSQETPIFSGSRPMYAAKSLLNPQLNPGRKVNIQSKFLKGIFEVYRILHQGDTEEGDYVTNMEVW